MGFKNAGLNIAKLLGYTTAFAGPTFMGGCNSNHIEKAPIIQEIEKNEIKENNDNVGRNIAKPSVEIKKEIEPKTSPTELKEALNNFVNKYEDQSFVQELKDIYKNQGADALYEFAGNNVEKFKSLWLHFLDSSDMNKEKEQIAQALGINLDDYEIDPIWNYGEGLINNDGSFSVDVFPQSDADKLIQNIKDAKTLTEVFNSADGIKKYSVKSNLLVSNKQANVADFTKAKSEIENLYGSKYHVLNSSQYAGSNIFVVGEKGIKGSLLGKYKNLPVKVVVIKNGNRAEYEFDSTTHQKLGVGASQCALEKPIKTDNKNINQVKISLDGGAPQINFFDSNLSNIAANITVHN